ncbi:Dihydrofolate reductase [Glycomyces sambucus]|uniref:Dihydrofolate reductase n=1 Tax=Glycomyces sambucus TaxID=380244 RepID=A0A1G9GUZ7_9ACTN|nr:dihydrofolate reductase family protein [Glycomyces sambucus]SDL04497.1 Dihydrofolate reductase [Glycomyces sambucus]
MTRRLVVQQWTTADGIVAEEDGGLGFVAAAPFDDEASTPFQDRVMALIDSVDTLILGATTYDQSKDGWPYAEDQGEYGRKLNALTKYVASSTLEHAPWGDFPEATVTRDAAATVRELKQQEGKDLWLWGSLTLMRSLMEEDLVDEVRMLVAPVTRGKGTRLFQDRRQLRLREATGFDNGVLLLRYDIEH